MYKIEKTNYGVKFTFSGFIDEHEMKRWAQDVAVETKSLPEGFCVFMDMRGLQPLPRDAWLVMQKAQERAVKAGMAKAVQVVDDPITSMQFRRFARTSGITDRERQIDASSVPDWENVAMDWLVRGVEPLSTSFSETGFMKAFTDKDSS
jgi:hypothetical protein